MPLFLKPHSGNYTETQSWLQSLSHSHLHSSTPPLSPPISEPITQNHLTSSTAHTHPHLWKKAPLHLHLNLLQWPKRGTGSKVNSLRFQKPQLVVVLRGHLSSMSRRSWTERTRPRPGLTLSLKPCLNLSKRSSGFKPSRFALYSLFCFFCY